MNTNYELITDIAQRRLNFLNDTVAYYTSHDRSVKKDYYGQKVCTYAPADDNTAGCAIGRHLPLELARSLDSKTYKHVIGVFEYLPNWMKEMGKGFLNEIQKLHDRDSNWTERGLTYSGIETVNLIRISYCQV